MRLPTRIPTAAQQRAQEAAWIKSCHAEWGLVLMELAGHRAAEEALLLFNENPGPVAVFCGRGNNGGDGLVVARYLRMMGLPVSVYMVSPGEKNKVPSESAVNYDIVSTLDIPVLQIKDDDDIEVVDNALAAAGTIVDGLFGTGLVRPVEGIFKAVIEKINESGSPTLSIDVPSGINSDTGQIMGAAVRADVTVTFGYLKGGLLCHPGADYCGEIEIVDIGLPDLSLISGDGPNLPKWWLTTVEHIYARLPARPDYAHKGTFGRILTVAGSPGMKGAAHLASKSALRAGAGLSVLAAPHSIVDFLPAAEVIYSPLKDTACGSIHPDALGKLKTEIPGYNSLVLGPGLSQTEETARFVRSFVAEISIPCVIDADALNAVAGDTSCLPRDTSNFILTPHPKELSRLTGVSTSEIQADRFAAALKAAEKFGCTVVLKGSRTIVANPEGAAFLNPTGNSAMATAGSGDVLSGIIGGLLAQGLSPFDAAVCGAYLHGAAGDLAAQDIGTAGIVAGDIMSYVPACLSLIRSGNYAGSSLEVQVFHRGR